MVIAKRIEKKNRLGLIKILKTLAYFNWHSFFRDKEQSLDIKEKEKSFFWVVPFMLDFIGAHAANLRERWNEKQIVFDINNFRNLWGLIHVNLQISLSIKDLQKLSLASRSFPLLFVRYILKE